MILLLFADIFLHPGNRVLSDLAGDLLPQYLPSREFAFSRLAHGQIPFWNPYSYSGAPYFADPQTALFYPLNLPFLFLGLQTAVNFSMALHVLLTGLFTFLWLARRRLNPAACLVGACVAALGGAAFLNLTGGRLSNLCSLSWIPLVFLALEGWRASRNPRWVALGMAAVALQILAGHPQYVFYTFLMILPYALVLARQGPSPWKFLGGAALFYAGALGLAAVQVLPTASESGELLRGGGLPFQVASEYFLPAQNIATLVTPFPWGDPVFYTEACLFMGVWPFWMALLAASKWRDNRLACGMSLAALLLALGSQTFIFNAAYRFVPFFGHFRGASKFGFFAIFFAGLLAAQGLDRLLTEKKFPSPRFVLFIAGVGLVSLITGGALLLAHPLGGETLPGLGKGLFYFGAASLLFTLALSFRRFGFLTLALPAVLELLFFAAAHRSTFDIRQYLARAQALQALLADSSIQDRVSTPFGNLGLGRAYDLWGFDPMVLNRYGRFIAFSQGVDPAVITGMPHAIRKDTPILGLLRYRWRVVDSFSGLQAYPTHLKVLPRAKFIDSFRLVPGFPQAFEEMASPGFDFQKTVLLENPPDPAPRPGKAGSLRLEDLSTDCIDIQAVLDHPSILLLTDNYARDWDIQAVGEPAQPRYNVMPADGTLRAVPLSAGTHHLRMRYRPRLFEVGKWISAVSLLLFLAFWLWCFRIRPLHRRSPQP